MVAGHLLRAFVLASSLDLDVEVDVGPEGDQARAAILDGRTPSPTARARGCSSW